MTIYLYIVLFCILPLQSYIFGLHKMQPKEGR